MPMDIGIYCSRAVLAHKLERRHHAGRVEEVWNCRHCPSGLGQSVGGDRLVVASDGRWRGFFRLIPEVLFTPADPSCPYALIFDAKSWTPITAAVPCKPFRGWTYNVPTELFALSETPVRGPSPSSPLPPDTATPPASTTAGPPPARPSLPKGGARRRGQGCQPPRGATKERP